MRNGTVCSAKKNKRERKGRKDEIHTRYIWPRYRSYNWVPICSRENRCNRWRCLGCLVFAPCLFFVRLSSHQPCGNGHTREMERGVLTFRRGGGIGRMRSGRSPRVGTRTIQRYRATAVYCWGTLVAFDGMGYTGRDFGTLSVLAWLALGPSIFMSALRERHPPDSYGSTTSSTKPANLRLAFCLFFVEAARLAV